MSTSAISFDFFFLAANQIATPIATARGAYSVTSNAINCAVTVVPILAPIITPTA
jgi:hypothetical protein